MPFCSTSRPTVMTVGAGRTAASPTDIANQGVRQEGELVPRNKGLQGCERAFAVRGHHISPAIDDPTQILHARTMALKARIVALGNHGMGPEPARCKHGYNVGLCKEGQDGIRLYVADRAPKPGRDAYELEAEGYRARHHLA